MGDRFEPGEQCAELEPECGTPGACCMDNPPPGEDPPGECTIEFEANCEGRFVPDAECDPDPFDPACGDWECTGILYAPSNPDDAAWRAEVAALTGGPVDYWDASASIPTLEDLADYCCVFTWGNYAYPDPVAMGDVLAAFVDQGGKVVLGQWTYHTTQTNWLEGAIMEPAYCPVTCTSYMGDSYVDGSGTDCLFCNVHELGGDYVDQCDAIGGASFDGLLTGGKVAAAWRPDRKVYYLPGQTGSAYTNGDTAQFIANTCGCTGPEAYGACCDPYTGDCTDDVECSNCQPPLQFAMGETCAGMDPPCGNLGACCDDNTGECTEEFKLNCDGRFLSGATCDPDPFTPPCGEYHACQHSVTLWDDYGDGWNDGFIDIHVDGSLVLAGVTLASGTGPETVYFDAGTGSTIQAIWTDGGWPYEASYCIYDLNGTQLGCDGLGGAYPAGITVTGNCEPLIGACCMEYAGCAVGEAADCSGVYLGDNTDCGDMADCDGDGMTDLCAIAAYGAPDCNENGIPDECDIAGGAPDCDGNGVPDECDPDCNENGMVDACDLDCSLADCMTCYPECVDLCDCQGDGVPDNCQIGDGGGKGACDICIHDDGTTENSLGLTNGGEIAWIQHCTGAETIGAICTVWGSVGGSGSLNPGDPVRVYVWDDPNGDGNPDDAVFLAEGSGVADAASIQTDVFQEIAVGPVAVGDSYFIGASAVHAAGTFPAPMDQTAPVGESWLGYVVGGTYDPVYPGGQEATPLFMADIGYPCNWLVHASAGQGGGGDCNANGIPDECDVAPLCDAGVACYPDVCSLDCNEDLVPDDCQLEGNDCNENGIPDDCDIASGFSLDCNGNGVPDDCDIADGTSLDCNENDIPDECDIASGFSEDCNGNGIPDECDVAAGTSCDCQDDGIPDECQLDSRSRSCDEMVYDNGVCDGVNGTRPTVGWNDTGVLVDLTVPQGGNPMMFSCFHMEILNNTATQMPSLQLRIYALPTNSIVVDLPSFAAATPLFDYTYTVASGELVITDREECYPGIPAEDYDASGPAYTFDPGSYAALVTFPGSGAINFWASAVQIGDLSYVWGAQVDAPSAGTFDVAFNFTGGAGVAPANDCNENGIPDECDTVLCEAGQPCFPDECYRDCEEDGIPDECQRLCGDLDDDDDVDLDDFNLFIDGFGDCDPGFKFAFEADLDCDGCITLIDYGLWLECYHAANP